MDPWLVLAMIFFQASFLCEAATSRNSSCTKIYGESGLHARCTIESVEELSTILHNPNDVKSLWVAFFFFFSCFILKSCCAGGIDYSTPKSEIACFFFLFIFCLFCCVLPLTRIFHVSLSKNVYHLSFRNLVDWYMLIETLLLEIQSVYFMLKLSVFFNTLQSFSRFSCYALISVYHLSLRNLPVFPNFSWTEI